MLRCEINGLSTGTSQRCALSTASAHRWWHRSLCPSSMCRSTERCLPPQCVRGWGSRARMTRISWRRRRKKFISRASMKVRVYLKGFYEGKGLSSMCRSTERCLPPWCVSGWASGARTMRTNWPKRRRGSTSRASMKVGVERN